MKINIRFKFIQSPSIIKIDQLAFIRNFIKDEGICDQNSISIPIKDGNFIKIQEEDNNKKIDLKVY